MDSRLILSGARNPTITIQSLPTDHHHAERKSATEMKSGALTVIEEGISPETARAEDLEEADQDPAAEAVTEIETWTTIDVIEEDHHVVDRETQDPATVTTIAREETTVMKREMTEEVVTVETIAEVIGTTTTIVTEDQEEETTETTPRTVMEKEEAETTIEATIEVATELEIRAEMFPIARQDHMIEDQGGRREMFDPDPTDQEEWLTPERGPNQDNLTAKEEEDRDLCQLADPCLMDGRL